ncbi:MAG: histidinol-phosphate aminotransferase family protein [Bacteroidetes bacterium]|nr:histidinol-phosphate aminotransferase family protein [Bacteroidota bacterium]
MAFKITRRNWLRSSAMIAAGSVIPIQSWANGITLPEGTSPTGEIEPDLNSFSDFDNPNGLRIRLNANENPYGPSDKAKMALREVIDTSFRYPFAETKELKSMIAEKFGLTSEHVALGGGSTEILTMAGMAFGLQNGSVISAFPTFRTLLDTARRFDCEWIQVPLDENFTHDLAEIADAIQPNTRLIYICNPNNPTGTLLSPDDLQKFCIETATRVPVFIDEAYTEFLDDPQKNSVIPLIHDGHDIIVAKTFSKIYGMAGLRVGFALGSPERIKQLEKYGVSLSIISKTSVEAAKACFGDTGFEIFCKKKNKEARDYTYQAINEAGYSMYIPSHASFIMFPINMEGKTFLTKMEKRGVGVRAWQFNDRYWCRVSMGTLEDMKGFGEILKEIS